MVKSSVLAFSDGAGGPLADLWQAWSRFVSPVGELYPFLPPPVFTLLIVTAFIGFVYLLRETSAARRLSLEAYPHPPARRGRRPVQLAAPVGAIGTVRAGLINGDQFEYRDDQRAGNDFTLSTGVTRPAQSASPARLSALRCKPDLNFHLDRAPV